MVTNGIKYQPGTSCDWQEMISFNKNLILFWSFLEIQLSALWAHPRVPLRWFWSLSGIYVLL